MTRPSAVRTRAARQASRSPPSRSAVTLLCTAGGEVMRNERQHLRVCWHRGTPPAGRFFASSSKVNMDGSQKPSPGAILLTSEHLAVQCRRGRECEPTTGEGTTSNTLPNHLQVLQRRFPELRSPPPDSCRSRDVFVGKKKRRKTALQRPPFLFSRALEPLEELRGFGPQGAASTSSF